MYTAASMFDGRDRSWMDEAACRNHPDPDLWYPDTAALYTPRIREAQQICASCPVKAECYDFGRDEKYGIFGGVLVSSGRSLPGPNVKRSSQAAATAKRMNPTKDSPTIVEVIPVPEEKAVARRIPFDGVVRFLRKLLQRN